MNCRRRTILRGLAGMALLGSTGFPLSTIAQPAPAPAGRSLTVPDCQSVREATLPDDVTEIVTQAFDRRIAPGLGAARYRRAAATGLEAIPEVARLRSRNGLVFVLAEERPFASMFGALGDLVVDETPQGFARRSGTDDAPALRALGAYVAHFGLAAGYTDQNHYCLGQIDLATRLVSAKPFATTVWQHLAEEETGFVVVAGNSGLKGFNLIIQHDTARKAANRGDLGNGVRVGHFLLPAAHAPVRQVEIDVRVCRAASLPGQRSYPSPSINVLGYSEQVHVRFGTFGKTNAPGSICAQAHWGAHIDRAGYPTIADVDVPLLASYHPNHLVLEPVGVLTGHKYGVILSAVGEAAVRGFRSNGIAKPLTILPGDNVNAFANPAQRPLVGRNIRIGAVVATDCGLAANEEAVLISARGTSKSESYPGTGIKRIRQLPLDVKCDGFDIAISGGALRTTAVRVFGALGRVHLGDLRETGATKASVEVEYGNADVTFDLKAGGAPVVYQYASGGSVLGSAVSTPPGAPPRYGVLVEGDRPLTRAAAALAGGSTRIAIVPFDKVDVHVGDTIVVDGHTVTATDISDAGVPWLVTTPLPQAVAADAVVMVDRTARLKRFVGGYRGSDFGLVARRADIANANLSDAQHSGRHAVVLDEARFAVQGGGLPIADPRNPAAARATIRIDAASHLTLLGVRIPARQPGAMHFEFEPGPGAAAGERATLVNCIIEDRASLSAARPSVAPAPAPDIRLIDCVDYTGKRLL
ncbi:MAG: hypothetical protein JNM13_16120 [Hyphomicrobiaceae bacterium]|nr:hypothetical protein [Hyphomicrobiaceae bacterium]